MMSNEELKENLDTNLSQKKDRPGGRNQLDPLALQHLLAVARHREVVLDWQRIVHDYALTAESLTRNRLLRIARDAGLKAKITRLSWRQLTRLGNAFPAILLLKDGSTAIVSGVKENTEAGAADEIVLFDITAQQGSSPFVLKTKQQLKEIWAGEVLLVKKATITKEERPFGLFWFVQEAMQQKRIFLEITLVAFIMHGIALAVPLYFQVIVDKVLVYDAVSTLKVVTVGILALLLFEGVLKFLRGYLLAFATSKIDLRMATKVFSHLLHLPLQFFERSFAGVLTKHMQQIEVIRQFLTGHLLQTLLDASALFVFIPLLFMYSAKLAMVVVFFSLLMALVIGVMIGPFSRRLQKLYRAEGQRQALLVETIHGMATVKSLALEPGRGLIWDNSVAQSVMTNFSVEKLANVGRSLTKTLERVMSVAILWYGAQSVFDHTLTVGALVAFQMIAGNVSGPLIQIVQTVNEYQKTALAVKMLGEIMDRSPESNHAGGLHPELQGKVDFEGVTFRYQPENTPALNNVSFTIEAGEIIGVVGRSGSGKSTLTRLIQGLYRQQSGLIRLDNVDLREIDLAHLRRSIGVVLQENFLFHGTVRQNISATKPDASFDEIMRAAEMAGAAEFIQYLPQGFDTMLEENGANLSGGQKQRLAIARALLKDPRVLIFDEATSALDVESEAVIQANLSKIAQGRTMILVAHRLSTLRDAHRIVVLDRGAIVAIGPHEELLTHCAIYRDLWELQTKSAR